MKAALDDYQGVERFLESGEAYVRFRSFDARVPEQERQLLVDSLIWFSAISDMDDPFEGRPVVYPPSQPPNAQSFA